MSDQPDATVKSNWDWKPILIVAAILGVLIVLVITLHSKLGIPYDFKTIFVFLVAAAALYGAQKTLLSKEPKDDKNIKYVVAFDSVVLIVVGLVAAILACAHWETALLLAGSSLLTGGFVGLLFGYPQGVAQQASQSSGTAVQGSGAGAGTATAPTGAGTETAQAGAGTATPPTGASSPPVNHAKNLVAESAATIGKLITGFTLAKLGPAKDFFDYLCSSVGPALGVQQPEYSNIFAGVLIAYFCATGFLSGLFLPSYFMKDQI